MPEGKKKKKKKHVMCECKVIGGLGIITCYCCLFLICFVFNHHFFFFSLQLNSYILSYREKFSRESFTLRDLLVDKTQGHGHRWCLLFSPTVLRRYVPSFLSRIGFSIHSHFFQLARRFASDFTISRSPRTFYLSTSIINN